jgi:phospholipid/cholesterol/gamma-HCH transport system substrate-binding protein
LTEAADTREARADQRARLVALLAIVGATVVLLVLLLGGGGKTRYAVEFENASQLVKGNRVTVAGERIGTVTGIRLTSDNHALVDIDVDNDYAPLRVGTRAIVRQRSLSGVANRDVELHLGPAQGADLDDGATIPAADTESQVEIDEIFNTFDPQTREDAARTLDLFRDFNDGNIDDARGALRYLDPVLSASSRLLSELNAGRTGLRRFVVESSKLVTDLSARDDDLASLVADLSTTMHAVASQRDDLGTAIGLLPAFLRRANTTFVTLRATLDDLDPLVDASKPVVRNKLRPLLAQLRPFAKDAVPTVRDLAKTLRQPGADTDAVDLLRRQPAIDKIANKTAQRNGKQRPGAFPATQAGAKASTPQIGFLRPYSQDLVGWFDDFSHTGVYDALGGFSRAGLQLNQFTLDPLATGLLPVPPELRDLLAAGTLHLLRNNRCPGSAERPAPDGSNPYLPTSDFHCDPSQAAGK